MASWKDAADRRPGPLPQIRTDAEDLIFEYLVPVQGPDHREARLILRCTRYGDVLASLVQTRPEGGRP